MQAKNAPVWQGLLRNVRVTLGRLCPVRCGHLFGNSTLFHGQYCNPPDGVRKSYFRSRCSKLRDFYDSPCLRRCRCCVVFVFFMVDSLLHSWTQLLGLNTGKGPSSLDFFAKKCTINFSVTRMLAEYSSYFSLQQQIGRKFVCKQTQTRLCVTFCREK